MAVVNLRIPEEMKRKLAGIAKATGASQTEIVKSAVAEKLVIHQVACAESSTNIPSWVPEGKFVALFAEQLLRSETQSPRLSLQP